MTLFAKKVLSAFVEVNNAGNPVTLKQPQDHDPRETAAYSRMLDAGDNSFGEHFKQLFATAAINRPGYHEFAIRLGNMHGQPGEKQGYWAAYAALHVEGINKQQLLSTAGDCLKLLDSDAAAFNKAVDAALHQKVVLKQQELAQKTARIQELTGEMNSLHNTILLLKSGIHESREMIEARTGRYREARQEIKSRIALHIEKIKEYIC